MKTNKFLPPPSPFGGALNKRSNIYLTVLCLIIATLWNIHSVSAAPAKTDLQPPIFEATASASTSPLQPNGKSDGTTIDSYGNPIESLQPIETPDGRKVVSAQGLQFEIPNYASGITELKKPADDLLPPFVDKIGSSSEEAPVKQKNPFLPTFNDGKYRPKSTTRRTTTTTTTTTTPAPIIVEDNPFEPTIPPWLKDFDYPDLAPGVPFVYDPNEDESPVEKDILPPSKTDESKPDSDSSSSNSPFSNSQKPQAFTNQLSSSTNSLASSSSIPSIVTIPLPSTQTNQADTLPPLVFVPPPATTADGLIIADTADDQAIKTSSTFHKNFAAPFEPTTVPTTSATIASDADQKNVPLSADRESFPPFNNVITGSSTLPSKTTFTKSEDGKVITNNIFLSGSLGSTSAKPFGSSLDKNTFSSGSSITKSTTTSSVFKQFGTTSSAASGFVTSPAASSTFSTISSTDGTKYTGRFGGPAGVLAPQSSGFTTSSTTINQSFNKPTSTTYGVTSSPGLANINKDKFTGSFGGPPGILKPYDNVKSG